ncbi:MAG: beta-mannosidase, partial [Candidatus Eisenbacteria bacterium]|nr:beta-mannosidase [Candidatus Eisenbacteria bacterium]
DGDWQLAEGGGEKERLHSKWADALHAKVPGSVHAALVEAGRLPDPTFALNQKIARLESFKTWWMRRQFDKPPGHTPWRLVFGGVCNRCTVWLNGKRLGTHEGMFGGPSYTVSRLLEERNDLIVRLDPVAFEPAGGYAENNGSWKRTVVFNNAHGWHYSNLQPLGIWRSVELQAVAAVELSHPFVTTRDAARGEIDLLVPLNGPKRGWAGTLAVTIEPDNFEGDAWHYTQRVTAKGSSREVRLRLRVPSPRAWWPVDLGEPNLYRMKVSFAPAQGGGADARDFTFGIRTVAMAPLPGGPRPDRYDWTFVINGSPRFVKGTGWCTMDPLLDFRRERYERFLELARQQHVQMLRAWGSGMPETDEFYDICDRKGIMVFQEWPTAWNSHREQPYAVLEETVRLNTLRLRNRASLVMWGGGNESTEPFGKAIDMMGRLSVELDGTRPFHRGEPWGGSAHNYDCYWGRQHLDRTCSITADFLGEFGLASLPVLESLHRYLPPEEKNLFPCKPDGALAYHTPIFGTADDLSRLAQFAHYFVGRDCTLADFVAGSQLAQVVGVRHVLEHARARWPECGGALYYKMNDNFPAASWSCVDWYGAAKAGHYFFQDAFAPLHAVVLFPSLNLAGAPAHLPTCLLDDADALAGKAWKVVARAYDGSLREITRLEAAGSGSITSPRKVGDLELSWEQAEATPLLVVSEIVFEDGSVADRTFYWMNFQASKGCLFRLPRTRLKLLGEGDRTVVVSNQGELPAVGVSVSCPGRLDVFTVSDNFFWLDPGEARRLEVSQSEGLALEAWNA